MKFFASKRIQRVTNFGLALMLVVSTISASVPFIFSKNVDAAPGVTYTNQTLSPSDWSVDRAVPSGGWAVDTAGQRVILNVNQGNANTALPFYQTEGVSKALAAGTDTVKADLYVAADWSTKPSLRVGLWGVAQDAGLTGPSYPIIEYANIGGYTGWRVWNTNTGLWTNVSAPTNVGGQNTVEIVSNYNTGTYDFYVNENKVLSYASVGYTTFTNLIFNNYNAATGDTAGNYSVIWKNIQKGVVAPDYSTVYVSPNGNDAAYGTSSAFPFKTIQRALDVVNVNGTVNVANGTYDGTAIIKKSGTKLIGQSKAGVTLYAQSSSGQAGVFANEVNDIQVRNMTVRAGSTLTAGSVIKFTNGTNGLIQDVEVKTATVEKPLGYNVTGIDINSFSNATITNIYIDRVGKDGVSITSKYDEDSAYTSNNVKLTNVNVSVAAWSAIAFYTTGGSNPTGEPLTGVQLSNIQTNFNARGIYFEGLSGKTITGVAGSNVNLQNAKLNNSSASFIVNGQSASVDAYGATFDNASAGQMTSAEYAALSAKIVDRNDNPSAGIVYLRTALVAPTVQTQGWTNAATTVNWTAATDRTATNLEYAFSYSTNRYTGFTTVSNGNSTTKDVSELFTTPGSYFVYVTATEDGVTATSTTVEIQVIGTLEITTIDGTYQAGSTATVNWTPVYGREQFDNYQVYVDGELVKTVTDATATSTEITLPNEVRDVEVYVKANFKASIGGGDSRTSQTLTIETVPAPVVPVIPFIPVPSGSTESGDGTTGGAQNNTATGGFTGVIGATANQGVLGVTTDDDNAAAQNGAADVAGATDDKTASAVDSEANNGTIFGLAWYWWILILAALAALAWFIIAAVRRRNEEQA